MARDRGSDESSTGGMGRLLMITAVVAIGGLFVYLSIASRPVDVPVVMMDDTVGVDTGPTAPPVLAADFGADPRSYWGQEIDLQAVTVAQVMSPEIIWVDIPTPQGMSPFAVKLTPALAAQGAPAARTVVNVEGIVLQKTDSVLNSWEQSGAIQNAGQRAQSEFGTTFIEARRIRSAGSQ